MDEDSTDVGQSASGGYHGANGTKVYYVDAREGHGILPATVTDVSHDGTAELLVKDLNAVGGCFNVMSSAHDEDMKPGTWHYPK